MCSLTSHHLQLLNFYPLAVVTGVHLGVVGSGKLRAIGWASVTDRKPYSHRFPLSIIQYALWLYYPFSFSQRDVQELRHQRGI